VPQHEAVERRLVADANHCGLRRSFPPRSKQGVTIFFTGLSGSGKSTIANVLLTKFLEVGGRPVTLLDGGLVRKNLSSELGFSKEHRDINIRRIGYVASEITKNGGIAICAPIAPYDATRKHVRHAIEPYGGFILVHIATSVEVCEQRDRKGLYAKARAGILKEFTGISAPYEAPTDAEEPSTPVNCPPKRRRRRLCCTWNERASSESTERLRNRKRDGHAIGCGKNSGWLCGRDPDLRLASAGVDGRRFGRALQFFHQNSRQLAAPEKRNGAAESSAGTFRG